MYNGRLIFEIVISSKAFENLFGTSRFSLSISIDVWEHHDLLCLLEINQHMLILLLSSLLNHPASLAELLRFLFRCLSVFFELHYVLSFSRYFITHSSYHFTARATLQKMVLVSVIGNTNFSWGYIVISLGLEVLNFSRYYFLVCCLVEQKKFHNTKGKVVLRDMMNDMATRHALYRSFASSWQ